MSLTKTKIFAGESRTASEFQGNVSHFDESRTASELRDDVSHVVFPYAQNCWESESRTASRSRGDVSHFGESRTAWELRGNVSHVVFQMLKIAGKVNHARRRNQGVM